MARQIEADKPKQLNPGDAVLVSYDEMLDAWKQVYERTGDLGLMPMIERAGNARLALASLKQTR